MNSLLYLGIDGGATKTSAVALDPDKRVVAEGTGKPSNFQIIGIEQASINILETLESLLADLNVEFSQIKSMCLALAGSGRKDDAERMRLGFISILEKRKYTAPEVRVESDAVAALEGAFGGKPGMILIGGTGSILMAKDDRGNMHRVGGWGRFVGDEGSGYTLGRSCLAAVAKEFDGRGRHTMMTQLLKAGTGIEDSESLIRDVYQRHFDIASAAPFVIEAAEKGDEVARIIIMENIDELAAHVSAIVNKLNKWLPLVLVGGILSSDNFFSVAFRKKMGVEFPYVEIRRTEFSPAMGAALLAYESGSVKK